MFIQLGTASGTLIGVEATPAGTAPMVVEGPSGPEVVQEPTYHITACRLVQAKRKRVATQADRRSVAQILPHMIAGDLSVTFTFPDGEVVVVSLDESTNLQQTQDPSLAKASSFLPTIKIHWRDRAKRRIG